MSQNREAEVRIGQDTVEGKPKSVTSAQGYQESTRVAQNGPGQGPASHDHLGVNSPEVVLGLKKNGRTPTRRPSYTTPTANLRHHHSVPTLSTPHDCWGNSPKEGDSVRNSVVAWPT